MFISLLLAATVTAGSPAQTDSSETQARVPELEKFHGVIYRLWHDAWPNKDYALMRTLLPEIEERSGTLMKAELPGILRDKKAEWNARLKVLNVVVAEFRRAVEQNDEAAMLSGGEQLHSQFESLVRIVRPPLTEVDAFHEILYLVYHYYKPDQNVEQIREAVPRLKAAVERLQKAVLPARLKGRQEGFDKACAALSASVVDLEQQASAVNARGLFAAVDSMHARYQELEKVFEP
jgi:hypothetical protein